ncbi:MAG: DUF3179 domain-containing protein [Desulfovibrionaceae bacterium]|nr:DUF3179 domain-containing protein [Desulfovibrionaceae bacterium]
MEDLQKISNNLLYTQLKYGSIPSIINPTYITMQEASLSMEHDDVVFIVMLPNGPHIYPQKIMVWHQVVNELINDFAYVITYCPTSGTLIAFDASMKGLNLIFDAEGRLYEANMVLMDRNSGSLWLQELGMAFEGPLAGRGLPMLRVYWTTFGAAKRVFPNAKVLNPPNSRKAYGRDPYGNYLKKGTYYDNDVTVYPITNIDRRLHKKTPTLCLELQGNLLGIDINYVKKKGVVNFFLGPMALAAMHDPNLDVVRIFDRRVWSEPFLFVQKNHKIVDIHTNSVWDPSVGKATEGPMQGSTLKQFYGHYSMWMTWSSINPETHVIPGTGEVPEKLLSQQPLENQNQLEVPLEESAPKGEGNTTPIPPSNSAPSEPKSAP